MLVVEYVPHNVEIAAEEPDVRTSVTTVVADAPASVAMDAPDINEQITDGVTEGGLTTHQMASSVTPSVQYPPIAHDCTGDAIQRKVNDRVATSGRAASIEETGEWGHGTMPIVQGIEPGISPAPFNDRYFAALPHAVESTDYMTPTNGDLDASAIAQAVAVTNANEAANPYAALLNF